MTLGEPAPDLSSAAAEQLYGTLAGLFRGGGPVPNSVLGPVLDVGAGSGRLAAELARRGVPLLLLDLTDARQAGAPNAPFLRGDASRLPVRSGSCSGVHLARVLLHLADWRAAAAECVRVLRPAGVLALSLGWRLYDGPLRELVGAVHDAAEARGLRLEPVRADLDGPEELDSAFLRLGLGSPELVEVSGAVAVTPRQAVADAVHTTHRWLPGQDLGALPDIGAAVLAGSGLDADQPIPQVRTVSYRVYRRER
ncbi:class I SAM-dependent methyltransferase [Streptoalloteichus hindustanus]|uniref:Methyltransferase domain-containing protein n=1 Tax=Streptoalloteichus hindustanus TaxID=2017 RepID=A0A1M4XX80_STRHI|nr:class I SAM-dependent methyltransferase [Streptoalloteichus hindustanus]SHE98069.1 Methyltransferase domain-containing protein [Streptoalloteichus hindustanus]